MKIIIAGNYKQARDYAEKNNLMGGANRTWRYASEEKDIVGYRDAELIFTGEYWLNPLYENPILARFKGWK